MRSIYNFCVLESVTCKHWNTMANKFVEGERGWRIMRDHHHPITTKSNNRRIKSSILPTAQREEYLFDPRRDAARLTKSESPTPDLMSLSIMDSLQSKHRVYDWVNFNVQNLVENNAKPNPDRVHFEYNNGEYSMTRTPHPLPTKVTRHFGYRQVTPPLCTSEVKPKRRNNIREASSSYFFDDGNEYHNFVHTKTSSKSRERTPKLYDSTGPNDERYYGKKSGVSKVFT